MLHESGERVWSFKKNTIKPPKWRMSYRRSPESKGPQKRKTPADAEKSQGLIKSEQKKRGPGEGVRTSKKSAQKKGRVKTPLSAGRYCVLRSIIYVEKGWNYEDYKRDRQTRMKEKRFLRPGRQESEKAGRFEAPEQRSVPTG